MPAYYAPVNFQRMTPKGSIVTGPVTAYVRPDIVTDIVIETEVAYFRVVRTLNLSSICKFHYAITSTNPGDFTGTTAADVTMASGQAEAVIRVQTTRAGTPVGDRQITCTLTAVDNCIVDPTKRFAVSTLRNFNDTSSQWWKSLAYRSNQPMAMGINSWVNPPLNWTDYEAAAPDGVNYVDIFAGNHFGSSLEQIATWALVQGGPDASTTLGTTGQFSWQSTGGQFATVFNNIPTSAAWGAFLFTIFPTSLRTDTGNHDTPWDEINAGTHDRRFQDMGGRLAVLCTNRGFPLSKIICVPCPAPQTAGVPFQIYAATRDKYKTALERIAGLMRTGSGSPTLRFAWCPAQNRTLAGEDFGPLANWVPSNYDAIGMSFRPDAQIVDRNSYDQWIVGNSSYYGLVGDVVKLAQSLGKPILIHNWGPRWQDCPIADLVYTWFYDEFLAPFSPRMLGACVFHNNTLIKTAASSQGEPGNSAWSRGVDIFKGAARWGRNVVGPPPPPITALDDSGSVDANSGVTIAVLNNDSGEGIEVTSVTTPAHGTAVAGGSPIFDKITYTPNVNYVGTDTFKYTITDDHGQTATANVNIRVNALPVDAVNDNATVQSGNSLILTPLTNDLGSNLTIRSVTAPSNGGTATISTDKKSIAYTPASAFVGTETFNYTITDGATTDTALITITVTAAPPPPPTCLNDNFAVVSGVLGTVDVLGNDSGVGLSVTAVTTPGHGTAAIAASGANVTYKSAASYVGLDSFNYTVTDSLGRTGTAAVNVTVVRATLNANNDNVSAVQGVAKTLDVLANDTGTGVTIQSITVPNHSGAAAISADKKTILYTPNAKYVGNETFNYTITDTVNTDTAQIIATVTAPPAYTVFQIPGSFVAACNRPLGSTLTWGLPAGVAGQNGPTATVAVPNSRGKLTILDSINIDTARYFMKYYHLLKSSWTSYDVYNEANLAQKLVTLRLPPVWKNVFLDNSKDSVGMIYDDVNDIIHLFYSLFYNATGNYFSAKYDHNYGLTKRGAITGYPASTGADYSHDSQDSGSTGAKLRFPFTLLRLWECTRINTYSDVDLYPLTHALDMVLTGYHTNPAADALHVLGQSRTWPAYGTDGTNNKNAGDIPYGTRITIRDEDLGAIDSTDSNPFPGFALPGDPIPQYKLNLSPIGKWLFNGIVDHGFIVTDATGGAADTTSKSLIRVAHEDDNNMNSWRNTTALDNMSNLINRELTKLIPLLWPLMNTQDYSSDTPAAYLSGGIYYATPGGPRRPSAKCYALDA